MKNRILGANPSLERLDFLALIAGASCLACGRPARDGILRQASLIRQGILSETMTPPLDLVQFSFCRSCLKSLPIFFPIKAWDLPDSRIEIITPFYYRPPISLLLVKLKFYQEKSLARPLATLCYILFQQLWPHLKDHILLPIPLAKSRFKERGYNQAGLIAGELAKLTGLALREDLLLRVKETKRQTETRNRQERIANLKDAFILNQTVLEKMQTRDKILPPILLIDDVTTTGATLKEAAQCLRQAGLKSSCLCLAWDQV